MPCSCNDTMRGVIDPPGKVPDIFTKTIYRVATDDELYNLSVFNLTTEELIDGFFYTMVGRGVENDENRQWIYQSLLRWVQLFPNSPKIKKHFDFIAGKIQRGESLGNSHNLSGLSEAENNPCGKTDLPSSSGGSGGSRNNPPSQNFIEKMIQRKVKNVADFAQAQIDCNIKKIKHTEWQKMLLNLDLAMLKRKLEPAQFNTIEKAKEEFIPPIIMTAVGIFVIGGVVGYFIGRK